MQHSKEERYRKDSVLKEEREAGVKNSNVKPMALGKKKDKCFYLTLKMFEHKSTERKFLAVDNVKWMFIIFTIILLN